MPGEFIPVEPPPGSVDLEDAVAADYAAEQLAAGNIEPFLERLRSPATLLPEERENAAELIETLWKRGRPGRPPNPGTKGNAQSMARQVSLLMALKGVRKQAAVSLVAEKKSVSASSVYAACSEHPQFFPLRK